MGLLSDINTATGEGFAKAYVPEGKHELLIKSFSTKEGTAKNKGKEWCIIAGEYVKSSRVDLPACAPGMPFSIFIETKPDPWGMAGNKLKGILNALASDADLQSVDRRNIPADCVQTDSNPYLNQPRGMTYGEFFTMCLKHKAAEGSKIFCTATNIDRSDKGKQPVTNYDFQKKGLPPMEIVAAPIAKPAPAPVAALPAAVPGNSMPVPGTAPAPVGGSLFNR